MLEIWITETTLFDEDIQWLLHLEYHKFWSQVIYDQSVAQIISSFLQEAVPCYTPISEQITNQNVLKLYSQLMKDIVALICRLITAKENENDWISNEFLGDLLYSKYIVSIPMVVDLIVTLGIQNHVVLNKILTKILKIQPKFMNDLKCMLEYIQTSMKSVHDQTIVLNQQDEIENIHPTDIHGYEMLCLYILDFTVTLNALFEISLQAKEIAINLNMSNSISDFYENCISLLYKIIIIKTDKHTVALKYLNNTRIELLNAFHGIVNFHLETLLNKDRSETGEIAETIITIFEESMSDFAFAVDYQKIYPVENDLDVIRQACDGINELRLDYIKVAYRDAHLDKDLENNVSDDEDSFNSAENDEIIPEINNEVQNYIATSEPSSSIPSTEASKIMQIMEVFPDYGEGYIKKLLKRYDMSAEKVISAILEGNLPPDLANADTQEPDIPEEIAPFFLETGIKRLNIYDGDEFDVMTNDCIKGGIYYKKDERKSNKKWDIILNDKSHIHAMKDRYSELGYVADEHEYSDEYDDSYDALADSETKTVKRNRSLAAAVVMDEVEDSDSSEDEKNPTSSVNSNEPNRDTSKDFCENPEAARERYQQQRLQKFSNSRQFKQRDVGASGKSNNSSTKKPDEEMRKNRHKKDVNKSSVANHNRKQGASYKRSKGML